MKHKVATLQGATLDAAVAKANGDERSPSGPAPYSRSWAVGGPLIEHARILIAAFAVEADCEWLNENDLQVNKQQWIAFMPDGNHDYDGAITAGGWLELCIPGDGSPTPLIAAMRAFVAAKFGEEVDLP